jgi:hypothetical protein
VRQSRPVLVASSLCVAVVGGALAYAWAHGAEVGLPVSAIVAAPRLPASSANDLSVAIPGAAPAPPIGAPAARGSIERETLAGQVDRLGRSADPIDAFAAYQLVTRCLWARDHEGWMAHHILPGDRELLPTTQQACGDIASDQIQSRLQWLGRAALAGVHHAATEMLKEGPDGLGVSASSDTDAPENALWKQRVDAALEAGIRTCDPESLDNRVSSYENGLGVTQDRGKALMYWVAYMDCRQRLDGAPAPILGNGDSVTQRMGSALDADQIATAVSAGQQLARDARPLPGDH